MKINPLSKRSDDAGPVVKDPETLVLAIVIYGGWLAATYFHNRMPTPLLVIVGGWLTAWQGSLQHETIHGHPTRSRSLNALIGSAPLSLWLPYDRYLETHLAHHASSDLTSPSADPESRYLARRLGPHGKLQVLVMRLCSTLLGRLLLGPAVEMGVFLAREAGVLAGGDRRAWKGWSVHLVAAALVIAWLKVVCRFDLLLYFAAFLYPGAALTLLRSFAEHRAAEAPAHRIAVVENAPVLGLLFLNNNLHAVHHAEPGAAWTQLPRLYKRGRSSILKGNNGLVYDGYADVVRRFLLAPHDDLFQAAAPGSRERPE